MALGHYCGTSVLLGTRVLLWHLGTTMALGYYYGTGVVLGTRVVLGWFAVAGSSLLHRAAASSFDSAAYCCAAQPPCRPQWGNGTGTAKNWIGRQWDYNTEVVPE